MLHDFLYMIFKYELYGRRQKKTHTILSVILRNLKKIENGDEDNIEGNELLSLVKRIYSITNSENFINSYIIMIILHSYVKFEATGKFINSSAKSRLNLAISRHAKIFESILC